MGHGLGIVRHQPFDLQFAEAEQRTALGYQEQAHVVVRDVDLGAAAGPGGVGITCGAQLTQRRRLGAVPVRVAEGLARRQLPLPAQGFQRGQGVGFARRGFAFQVALGFDGDARDAGARPRVHLQAHDIGLARGAARGAAERDLRLEEALGLQQFGHLRRRGVDEARPLGVVDVHARHGAQPHQVEVAFEQRLQRRRRDDLHADTEGGRLLLVRCTAHDAGARRGRGFGGRCARPRRQ